MQKSRQPERNRKYIVWRKKNTSKIIVLAKAYTKTHYNFKEIIAIMRGLLLISRVVGTISFKERPDPVKLPSCENFLLLDNIRIKSYLSLSFLPTYFLSSHIIYTNIKRGLNVIPHFCFLLIGYFCLFVCLLNFFKRFLLSSLEVPLLWKSLFCNIFVLSFLVLGVLFL